MSRLLADLARLDSLRFQHIDALMRVWQALGLDEDGDTTPQELVDLADVNGLARVLGLDPSINLVVPGSRPTLADTLVSLWDVATVRVLVRARSDEQLVEEAPAISEASLPTRVSRQSRVTRWLSASFAGFRSRLPLFSLAVRRGRTLRALVAVRPVFGSPRGPDGSSSNETYSTGGQHG
jgi:hypothetical protein